MVHPRGYGPNYGYGQNEDIHTISSPDLVSPVQNISQSDRCLPRTMQQQPPQQFNKNQFNLVS